MKKSIGWMFIAVLVQLVFSLPAYGSEPSEQNKSNSEKSTFHPRAYSRTNDIAFISIWGSHPDMSKFKGFQRAVLYNAMGKIVKKVDMGSDSIFSLDKMIEENRIKGPLFIKMFR